jgi:hypothetical protein
MNDQNFGEPSVFVVTIRSSGREPEDIRGSVMPVTASGRAEQTKRWFHAIDQIPGIIRGFLSSFGQGQRS